MINPETLKDAVITICDISKNVDNRELYYPITQVYRVEFDGPTQEFIEYIANYRSHVHSEWLKAE